MTTFFGSKMQDLEFRWFTSAYGDGWEVWRSLASDWISNFDYGIDQRRSAVTRFLEEYLVPNFITTPNQYFFETVPDYRKFIETAGLSAAYQIRQINEVSTFIDWIIEKEYSEPNDNGVVVALVNNPIDKEKSLVKKGETVYSPLPRAISFGTNLQITP